MKGFIPYGLSIWNDAAQFAQGKNISGVGIIYFAGHYFISPCTETIEATENAIRNGTRKSFSSFNEAAQTAEKEWVKTVSEKRLL